MILRVYENGDENRRIKTYLAVVNHLPRTSCLGHCVFAVCTSSRRNIHVANIANYASMQVATYSAFYLAGRDLLSTLKHRVHV